jgi:HAD superfamily hydrolase (TIGR01509 family)
MELNKVIMLKGIFVDFDGTLVDSLPALWKCYLLFLSHYGISGDNEEFTSLMGPSIYEIAGILREKYSLQPTVEELVKEYEGIVAAAYSTSVVLFPWAIDVLRQLKSKGLRLAVVTAASQEFVQEVFERYNVQGLFEYVFGSQMGEPTKPEPAVYLRALRNMRLSSDEVIAIEDAPSGYKSATSAGINTILFDARASSSQLHAEVPKANSWIKIGHFIEEMISG